MLNNIGPAGLILMVIVLTLYVALWWVVPMKMAKARNRNQLGWVLGAHLLAGPIAIFLLAVMGKAQDNRQ